MKLSVAANWDLELLEGLALIPEVTSIYAKLPFDLVGGGRAGVVVPFVEWDFAAAYIAAAHDRSLSFCYLINAPCLNNLEQTEEGKDNCSVLSANWSRSVSTVSLLPIWPWCRWSGTIFPIWRSGQRPQLADQSFPTQISGIPWHRSAYSALQRVQP